MLEGERKTYIQSTCIHDTCTYQSSILVYHLIYQLQYIEDLCGCFECTDWSVFLESCDDLIELNDHVTGYLKFCEGLVCSEKIIKCYPNNKPWIAKEVKDIITRKRITFSSGDKGKFKSLQKELRDGIRKCREKYREKLEANLSNINCKATWEIMKAMAGMNNKKKKKRLVY